MRLPVWLELGRVSNLPTVWSNVLAATALAGASPGPSWLCQALLFFSLFYVAGMYLNDAFDRRIDARERPSRPIPSGRVSAKAVFIAGLSTLGASVLGVVWLSVWRHGPGVYDALFSALLLAAAIVFYDLYHKNNPLSPFFMGLCRVLVYVTTALAVSGAIGVHVWLGAGALLCHLIGLTYAAKQENLRQLKGVWPLFVLVVPVAYGIALGFERPIVWGFVGLFALWLVYSVRFLLSPQGRSIPAAVVRLIAGIALLDAVLLSSTGATLLALLAVAFCALTRVLQRVVPGT